MSPTVLAARARVATSLLERSIGLLGTSSLPAGEGLWLKPCSGVHTLFMRYPIDLVFLNPDGVVIFQQTLATWRMSRWISQAEGVLELPAGTLERTQTQVDDRVLMRRI